MRMDNIIRLISIENIGVHLIEMEIIMSYA